MSKQVRLPKKFEWMRPYIKAGMKFVNKKHKLARVGAWNYDRSLGVGVFAALYQDKLGAEHRIWMHTHYAGEGGVKSPWSKIDLLNLLAHEIAHMEDWNHTPKHNFIESQIKAKFSLMLAKDGYISEEKEMRDLDNETLS